MLSLISALNRSWKKKYNAFLLVESIESSKAIESKKIQWIWFQKLDFTKHWWFEHTFCLSTNLQHPSFNQDSTTCAHCMEIPDPVKLWGRKLIPIWLNDYKNELPNYLIWNLDQGSALPRKKSDYSEVARFGLFNIK